MKISYLLFCGLFFGILFTGCKKDDEEEPATQNVDTDNTSLLTAHAWQRNSIKFDPKLDTLNLTIEEIFPFLASCYKDNLSYYETDLTGKDDEGSEKCESSDPQERPFIWAWTNQSETSMVMTFDEDVYLGSSFNLGQVIELTDMVIGESTMTAKTVIDYNGTMYSIQLGYETP